VGKKNVFNEQIYTDEITNNVLIFNIYLEPTMFLQMEPTIRTRQHSWYFYTTVTGTEYIQLQWTCKPKLKQIINQS